MLQIKNTLGGGKPEGLYVWKKYSTLDILLEKYISTTEQKSNIFPYSSSNVLYKSSSYTFDKNTGIYTLVNPTSVSGSTLQDSVHMHNGEYFMLNANSGATMYKAPTKTSQDYGVTVFNSAYNGFGIQTYGNYGRAPYYIYSNESGIEKTFISCIVANDESAYPVVGEKNGYWYERVVGFNVSALGITNFEIGSFTLTSASSSNTVNHSLGILPKAAILFGGGRPKKMAEIFTDSGSGGVLLIDDNGDVQSSTYDAKATTTTVKFHAISNSYAFKAGLEYRYAIFA